MPLQNKLPSRCRFRRVLVVVFRRVLKWNPTRAYFAADKHSTQNPETNHTGYDIKIVRFSLPPAPPKSNHKNAQMAGSARQKDCPVRAEWPGARWLP